MKNLTAPQNGKDKDRQGVYLSMAAAAVILW